MKMFLSQKVEKYCINSHVSWKKIKCEVDSKNRKSFNFSHLKNPLSFEELKDNDDVLLSNFPLLQYKHKKILLSRVNSAM
jgi:hypothetical protein